MSVGTDFSQHVNPIPDLAPFAAGGPVRGGTVEVDALKAQAVAVGVDPARAAGMSNVELAQVITASDAPAQVDASISPEVVTASSEVSDVQ